MRATIGTATLLGVEHDASLEPRRREVLSLEVEIEIGLEPMRGSLAEASGAPSPFWGWTEFAAAVEAARCNAAGGVAERVAPRRGLPSARPPT